MDIVLLERQLADAGVSRPRDRRGHASPNETKGGCGGLEWASRPRSAGFAQVVEHQVMPGGAK